MDVWLVPPDGGEVTAEMRNGGSSLGLDMVGGDMISLFWLCVGGWQQKMGRPYSLRLS